MLSSAMPPTAEEQRRAESCSRARSVPKQEAMAVRGVLKHHAAAGDTSTSLQAWLQLLLPPFQQHL